MGMSSDRKLVEGKKTIGNIIDIKSLTIKFPICGTNKAMLTFLRKIYAITYIDKQI